MSSRMSKGCLPCRTRKVKCDEGRPSCRRCVQRREVCTGYRDVGSFIFCDENEKVARTSVRRRASTQSLTKLGTLSQTSTFPLLQDYFRTGDLSDLSGLDLSGLDISSPFSWAKTVPKASLPSVEDQAVDQFFEKFVMYPCNESSSPGFLEHLPGLLSEVNNIEGRMSLRWAVQAAAYANISNDQQGNAISNKALQCYGLALSALAKSLADPSRSADDHVLMTIVILDIFESIYLQDSISLGSHAQGMAQILRLRGPDQIYSARGWSLFRLAHHRLQKQQLASKQRSTPLPESEAWLDSLNEALPYVRIEKQNFEINKICERARSLIRSLDDADLSAEQMLDIIKEMHQLDQVTTTWRNGPEWLFKTISRSDIAQGESTATKLPEVIQLHRDVWIAYEWNYHRTGRIILHEHLLLCLDRFQSIYPVKEPFTAALNSFRQASVVLIHALVDEVLSTVPQSLGDIDHEGNILEGSTETAKCKGIGGYFLLWPIKIIKSTRSATPKQWSTAKATFERIRDCTGMKSVLGKASCI